MPQCTWNLRKNGSEWFETLFKKTQKRIWMVWRIVKLEVWYDYWHNEMGFLVCFIKCTYKTEGFTVTKEIKKWEISEGFRYVVMIILLKKIKITVNE